MELHEMVMMNFGVFTGLHNIKKKKKKLLSSFLDFFLIMIRGNYLVSI